MKILGALALIAILIPFFFLWQILRPSPLSDWMGSPLTISVGKTTAIRFTSATVYWKIGRIYPYLAPWIEVVDPTFGPLPNTATEAPKFLSQTQTRIGIALIALQHGIDIVGRGAPSFTGRCTLESRSCQLNIFGGTAILSAGPNLTATNIEGKALSQILSVNISGKLSGTLSTKETTTHLTLNGLRLSADKILSQLPPILGGVPSITSALTQLIESPIKIAAAINRLPNGFLLHELDISNEAGKLIAHNAPYKWGQANSIPFRWLPNESRLPRDIATAITDPDGKPSLTLTAQISERGIKMALSQSEIDQKGKAWLRAKIQTIDKQKLLDAISKLRF